MNQRKELNQRMEQKQSGDKKQCGQNRLTTCTENPYDELLSCDPPTLKHPHMPLSERAKIFSPFAALTGHSDALKQLHDIKDTEKILSDTEAEALNRQLLTLEKGSEITYTYYDQTVRKYRTESGTIKKIRTDQGTILLENGQEIAIIDLIHVEVDRKLQSLF